MSILEDITSKDPSRIWSSSCAIRKLRDKEELSLLVKHLDEIREKTKDIPLGGTLRPNSSHLEFAIRKLEFVKNAKECICSLYTSDDLFNPVEEEQHGNVRILGTTLNEDKRVDFYDCQCSICGAKFRVEEREYHYTWWAWRRA